jgi:hypothetical protein
MHEEPSGVRIMAYTTIDDPSAYFQTKLYTGNGSQGHAITNDGNSDLQPDWLWIKQRNSAKNHNVYDSTRGVTKQLRTNLANAEATNTTDDQIVSLNSDGFTLGDDTDSVGVNENTNTYVAWQWKSQGGSTVSNTDGSITSTVQANTTAGFSIVTYTHTGNDERVGHGLGATPKVVIVKERGGAGSWYFVTTQIDGSLDYLLLEGTNAKGDLGYSEHTSTTFPSMQFDNGDTAVAYCFAEKQGYSKFGSFKGNSSTDGSYIYTGMKPSWIMIKKTNNTSQWVIHDTTRQEFNMQTRFLQANQSAAESTASAADLDILSNGFKLRSSDDAQNGNGDTYIYLAFASSPFVSSEAVPTTAR